MKVSIGIIALNEEEYLPDLIKDIKNQSYEHSNIEIIFIDSMSKDNSRGIMELFRQNNDFWNVRILDNRGIKQSYGWNEFIKNAKGDILIRIDAHSSIPRDFVERNVRIITSGEYVCGGIRPCIIKSRNKMKKLLLLAENSMFGSSIADYRNNKNTKKYVSSIFHGAYRKEVFDKVGLFNTHLGRTEDNEIHYRIRNNGYKICCDSSIVSYQYARPTIAKMIKQKFSNGYWCSLTLGVCPKCVKYYHFVPGFFVLSLAASIAVIKKFPIIFILCFGSYIILNILITIMTLIKNKNIYGFILPLIFFIMHIAYGMGNIWGIITLPIWLNKNKNAKLFDRM